jgi:hypothetical protein
MHLRPLALTLVAAAATACTFGPTGRKFLRDHGAHGIRAEIVTVQSVSVVGELLAVEDAGLLIDGAEALTLVSYAAIRQAHFKDGDASLADDRTLPPRAREALRLRSRFPQGVSEELLRKLLAARRQDALRRYTL